jgi:hypothetical protein
MKKAKIIKEPIVVELPTLHAYEIGPGIEEVRFHQHDGNTRCLRDTGRTDPQGRRIFA